MEQNSIKNLVEEYANKIWNNKDLNVIDQLVDENVISHSLLGDFHGKKALRSVVEAWLKAFPDMRVENDLVVSEGEVVCVQWRVKGTHQGEFKGKQPTGKAVSYSGVTIYRIRNNKIVEYWAYIDMQHLLNQL